MSTQAPPASNPGKAMEGFIGSLKESGMEDAAAATLSQPKVEGIAPTEQQPAPADKPPEKAPEIKPPEVKPTEQAKPAESEEDKWPRSAKDWDAFKAKRKERETALSTERDAIKAERDKLNGEIDALKKSGPSPELDGLKKERDQLSEQLRIVSVENHPKFKAYFENKTNAQIELAKRVVGVEHADKLATLLKSPDSPLKEQQIEEIISLMTPLQQSRVGSVLNALSEIQAERLSEISKAKENFENMQKEQQDKQTAQVQQFQKLFDDTVKQASEGNPLFQTKTGDDAWNADVTKRVETAKNLIFGTPNPGVAMKFALDAVAYPAILKQTQTLTEENGRLKAQVAELSKATPSVQSKEGEGAAPKTPTVKPGSSPAEALGGWVKGLAVPTE